LNSDEFASAVNNIYRFGQSLPEKGTPKKEMEEDEIWNDFDNFLLSSSLGEDNIRLSFIQADTDLDNKVSREDFKSALQQPLLALVLKL